MSETPKTIDIVTLKLLYRLVCIFEENGPSRTSEHDQLKELRQDMERYFGLSTLNG